MRFEAGFGKISGAANTGAAGCLFTWAETPHSGPASSPGWDTVTAVLASTVTGYFLSCFPL